MRTPKAAANSSSPRFPGERRPRLAAAHFGGKSHAVGEGQQHVPAWVQRRRTKLRPVRSKRLPLTCRYVLGFASGDILSPEDGGEEKEVPRLTP